MDGWNGPADVRMHGRTGSEARGWMDRMDPPASVQKRKRTISPVRGRRGKRLMFPTPNNVPCAESCPLLATPQMSRKALNHSVLQSGGMYGLRGEHEKGEQTYIPQSAWRVSGARIRHDAQSEHF